MRIVLKSFDFCEFIAPRFDKTGVDGATVSFLFLLKENFLISSKTMSDPKLDAVPNVQIEDGIFKYVLIKVYGKESVEGKENFKFIVRGFERAEWHCE